MAMATTAGADEGKKARQKANTAAWAKKNRERLRVYGREYRQRFSAHVLAYREHKKKLKDTATEKRCSACGVVKPVEMFYRMKLSGPKLHSKCKPCTAAYAKARLPHKKKVVRSDAQREAWAAYMRSWRDGNDDYRARETERMRAEAKKYLDRLGGIHLAETKPRKKPHSSPKYRKPQKKPCKPYVYDPAVWPAKVREIAANGGRRGTVWSTLGPSAKTISKWMRTYPEFAAAMATVRSERRGQKQTGKDIKYKVKMLQKMLQTWLTVQAFSSVYGMTFAEVIREFGGASSFDWYFACNQKKMFDEAKYDREDQLGLNTRLARERRARQFEGWLEA